MYRLSGTKRIAGALRLLVVDELEMMGAFTALVALRADGWRCTLARRPS